MGEATGKNGREASSRFHGARSETGRGGDGPAEILSGRMGVHRDIPKVGVLSERGEEHRSVHQQARAGREFADQHVPFARACRRLRGIAGDDLGAKEKTYKAYVFGNDFPGALVQTGQFEGDALVYRTEMAAQGATVKLRNVTRLTGPRTLVSEQFMAMKDAPEKLFVRVEAKKR